MTAAPATTDLAQRSIDTVRVLTVDAVEQAQSGHPGMPMGCAPIAYLLYHERMRHDPTDPSWWARDRFVLSAGHGSMLLYSFLHLTGYDRPTLDDLRDFRQWGSPTPGHPEVHDLPGVETTTGPLGQGFANGVGMAIAAHRLAHEMDPEDVGLLPQRIYGIVSDGDVMEGVASEAASLAGHLRLGRLVYLYDDNQVTIDGHTDISLDTEDVAARFDAYGWHTVVVDDGNDLDALRAALDEAEADDRPSLIRVRTVIGFGTPDAGEPSLHSDPLGPDAVAATKETLGFPTDETFLVPDDVAEHLDHREEGARVHDEWRTLHSRWAQDHPERAEELQRRMELTLPAGWRDALPSLSQDTATRKASSAVINALAPTLPELFGGSADLAASNKTDVDGGGTFSAEDRGGRNLRFGVREHGMASTANGIALHGGFRPYAATFLIFTDYARPGIRLSALMEQPVVFVTTHDSVGLGEDGPTHQPVEHLASLRAMPNMTVYRPADAAETVGAWASALQRSGPSVLALTRQDVPALDHGTTDVVAAVDRGAYILRDPDDGDPEVLLIGTGSEVQLAVEAARQLADDQIRARVVSMPSWERFADQDQGYRVSVIPPSIRARIAVEAGASLGWERIVGLDGAVVGIDRFGSSAPGERVLRELGMTADAVVAAARRVLGR